MRFRWGFGNLFDVSQQTVMQNELCCYSKLSFLQAEEEERILFPVNYIITKKQCEGKGRAAFVAMLSVYEECKSKEKDCEAHFTNKQCEFSIAV
jgi:hypothetical protein